MIIKLYSAAVDGIDGLDIEIEIDVSDGLPNLVLVGLPDTAIKESRERIRSAMRSSGYRFPSKRVVVNLAPASLKKEGSFYDLPMALGILKASEQIDFKDSAAYCIFGELSLDGQVKGVSGVLPMVLAARARGLKKVIVPYDNRREAAVVHDMEIYPVKTLQEAIHCLWNTNEGSVYREPAEVHTHIEPTYPIDFADVKGQHFAKRALEIAAAGGHNIVMIGPPGSGKSMLAKRLPTILPSMHFEEAIECTKIHSVMGLLSQGGEILTTRPFRSPHHSVSHIGLVGGGRQPQPGEITLAHHGVLFLDELPEFQRAVLEVMRQPLEDGHVTISRAAGSLTFPAQFMLVAAMNPCPCGFLTDDLKPCHCSTSQVQKYLAKISGPLLDRIDIHVEVPAVRYQEMMAEEMSETSSDIRSRVQAVRDKQRERFARKRTHVNGRMSDADMKKFCKLSSAAQSVVRAVVDEMGYSARAYGKILKLGRTIADMAGEEQIGEDHILEAVQYRSLDRLFSIQK